MIELHEEERPEGEDEIQLPEALQFLFTPSRYKVPYGGRGSAKSHSVARALLILCASTQLRVLCGREYQKSIQDSVHKLLSDLIESMGLQEYYKVLQYEIRSVMGGGFIFEGLHNNITKIKSIEGINVAWVEEAEKVSKSSWDTLIPTIRTPWLLPIEFLPEGTALTEMELETGCRIVSSEIWVTFNPSEETDDTYKRFVLNPPPNCISRLINWRDNPWFPKELMDEKDWHFKTDPDGAMHVWEGQCRKMSAAQILRDKYRVEAFEPLPHWDGPYYGVDFGFAADPNAGVKLWVGDRCLWVEYEVYGIGVELDDTPGLFKRLPDIERHTSRADSSRPETISHCRRHGIPGMEGVDKWPGSVEDGIKYLRGEFECIVIHPRCIHTQQEAKLWSYKVDKNTEDILPIPEDKNNHCFVAGTLILTRNGEIPIECIQPGDMVLTRAGYRPVIEVFDNGIKEVKNYHLGGRLLTCTPTHNIITIDGKTYAKDIVEDTWIHRAVLIMGRWQLLKLKNTRRSFLMAYLIAVIHSLRDAQTGFISPHLDAPKPTSDHCAFMWQYGNMPMAQYLKAIMSTTLTVIREITDWKIFNYSNPVNTCQNIPSSIIRKIKVHAKNTWILLETKQKCGMQVKKAASGIANMLYKSQPMQPLKNKYVKDATKYLKQQKNAEIVLAGVIRQKDGHQDLMMSQKHAHTAANNSAATNIRKQNIAAKNVPSRRERVYDLSVEDCHEYVANGVLVSNCWDAIRYALAPMIKSKVSIDKTWWKYCEDVPETRLPTLRFMTIALDDVEEDAAQLRVMIQLWGAEGATSMRLHSELMAFGSVPELLDEINMFWLERQKDLLPRPSELWMDGRSVGQSLIKELRRRKIPAREWAPDDKMVLDTSWRAKQASVHIANGRVIVPRDAMVVSEITGLATNAMSLALLIWQSRGGGK